jgi:GNAT superfamily N-acetyltransferase
VIATQRPEHARWIAPLTRLTPVAYTVLGYVQPDERSAGVGAALAARLHDTVDGEAIAATLLHYEQLNPYAAPFWSRQGYRPLWTIWEARPARTLRFARPVAGLAGSSRATGQKRHIAYLYSRDDYDQYTLRSS